MGRTSLASPEIAIDDPTSNLGSNGDLGIRSNHDRSLSLFKRTLPHLDGHNREKFKSDRLLSPAGGIRHRSRRKGFQFFKGNSLIYSVISIALFGFVFGSIVLQSSITSVFRQGGEKGGASKHGLRVGSSLRFVGLSRFHDDGRLDQLRKEGRNGVRPPRLALVSICRFIKISGIVFEYEYSYLCS
uniref:Uncharacterized protein n=1 Tax=Opuntia streptacantha TaxID=393608 RepID=A0A7C9DJQ0_OPUST